MTLKLPTIDERESEHDNIEELERKKKDYTYKISRMRTEVEELKRQQALM